MLATLDSLVRAGKVRYVGVSNFSGWQIMKSLAVAEKHGYPRYVANQAYYSLIGRDYEWELMPLGLDQGLGTLSAEDRERRPRRLLVRTRTRSSSPFTPCRRSAASWCRSTSG